MYPFGWSDGEIPNLPAVFEITFSLVPSFGFRVLAPVSYGHNATRETLEEWLAETWMVARKNKVDILKWADEHLVPEAIEAFTWLVNNKKSEIIVSRQSDFLMVQMDADKHDATLFKLFWL